MDMHVDLSADVIHPCVIFTNVTPKGFGANFAKIIS